MKLTILKNFGSAMFNYSSILVILYNTNVIFAISLKSVFRRKNWKEMYPLMIIIVS